MTKGKQYLYKQIQEFLFHVFGFLNSGYSYIPTEEFAPACSRKFWQGDQSISSVPRQTQVAL